MNLYSLVVKLLTPPSQTFNYQIVRWRRPKKPFWLGIAKSKMFVVPQPRVIRTQEEKAENRLLEQRYSAQIKSLLHFIKSENTNLNETVEGAEGTEMKMSSSLEEKISESWKNNESWNAETARLREIRLKEEEEKHFEVSVREASKFEYRKKKELELIEGIVRKEKEMYESYITPKNLDEAVEACLNKVVCYDFAIDLEGNKYPGRESLAPEESEKVSKESCL